MKDLRLLDPRNYDRHMKGRSSRTKQATHERIVETAARVIRRSGYDGTSVADLMKEAGLTHGGFYAHFASREAMLAEAADYAGAETVAAYSRIASTVSAEQSLHALLSAYLSREHLNNPELGCPIAALGSETSRQSPAVRRTFTQRFKEMIDVVSRQSTNWGKPETHNRALATAATMIGAMVLARAVDEEDLAESILAAARYQLIPAAK